MKISCIAVYPEASYVDTFWLFNRSRKQTNFKYEVNNVRFRKRTEGAIKSRNISLTIYNAGLNDSGQFSLVLNTSHGLRLKTSAFKSFLMPLASFVFHYIRCLEPIDDSSQKPFFSFYFTEILTRYR